FVLRDAEDGSWQFLGDSMTDGGGPVISCFHPLIYRVAGSSSEILALSMLLPGCAPRLQQPLLPLLPQPRCFATDLPPRAKRRWRSYVGPLIRATPSLPDSPLHRLSPAQPRVALPWPSLQPVTSRRPPMRPLRRLSLLDAPLQADSPLQALVPFRALVPLQPD